MVNKLRKMTRNEKGFTLVELLAVIVILGIIAAIAVPSIAGVIERSRMDAHVANARQMIESSRLYVVSENIELGDSTDPEEIYLHTAADKGSDSKNDLVEEGYFESMPDDPTGSGYLEDSRVEVYRDSSTGNVVYEVFLEGSKHRIGNDSNPRSEDDLSADIIITK